MFMKLIVPRFFHLSKLLLPQPLPPPSQGHLKDIVNYWPWEHVKQDTPCLFRAWQHHPAAVFLSDCLSQCLWVLLGKKGRLFHRIQLEGWGKGTVERAVKNIPISACCHIQLLWQDGAEKAFPAVAIAFTGYCSLAAVMYRQLQPTGLQHWEPAAAAANFGPSLRVTSSDSV